MRVNAYAPSQGLVDLRNLSGSERRETSLSQAASIHPNTLRKLLVSVVVGRLVSKRNGGSSTCNKESVNQLLRQRLIRGGVALTFGYCRILEIYQCPL